VLRVVAGALGWPHAELWLIDPLTDTLRNAGQWSAPGLSLGDLADTTVDKGVGITGTVWATGQPIWVADLTGSAHLLTDESLSRAQVCAEQGIRTVLAVPVRAGDVMLGVLAGYADTPEYDEDLLAVLLTGTAAHIGLSVTMRRAADLNGQLSRSRDDFLTLVGHELRTPLTTISGYAALLADDPGAPADDVRLMVEAIDRKAHALRGLVDTLLKLAGLESGHIALTVGPIDLAAIVADAVAAKGLAAEVRIHAELPESLPMNGDAARLRQVVDNLLSNAIMYSPDRDDVHVRLRDVAGVAELRVDDQGIGIPEADQERVFSRFHRAGNVEHQGYPGAGLGLALVRVITELHHGSVTLDTSHQPGTSVLLRLPRYTAASDW
jgi:signal transduction histidine kinase